MKEALMSIDEFGFPKIIEGLDVVNLKIIRLLMFEPGTCPDRPRMGIGLQSEFRYIKRDNLYSLISKITSQINDYIPELSGVEVKLDLGPNKILNIAITADEAIYEYKYDGTKITNRTLNDVGGVE